MSTNDLVAKVVAEKNTLTLEQHTARLEQLRVTYKLRREAAAADLRILEIRRERAERALRYAEENATRMRILAPFPGLVVVKTMWRMGGAMAQVEIMEGDEVRPGQPIIDVVDTSAMQVRARVNQADAGLVHEGQAATIRLDGFPELTFKGRVDHVTPLATTGMSQTVRTLVAIVSVDGTHAQLLPDLTASVEIAPATSPRPGVEQGQPMKVKVFIGVIAMVVAAAIGWQRYGRTVEPTLPTAEVQRGAFADVVEIRGEVRPVRTTLVMAPSNAGELTILKIAKNGTAVKPGDIVAEFDAMTMRRTIQEKQSDLRSALAELNQAREQSKLTLEERNAAVRRARFETVKAKLSVTEADIAGAIKSEESKLALADAQQRLAEAEAAEAVRQGGR